MPKTRILHIIGALTVGGAEWNLYKILASWNRDRDELAVLTLRGKGGPIEDAIIKLGIPVFAADMGKVPSPLGFYRLVREVNAWKPDLIQGWMYHSNAASILVRPFLKKKAPAFYGVQQTIYDLRTEKKLTQWVVRFSARLSHRAVRIFYNSHISITQHEKLGLMRAREGPYAKNCNCLKMRFLSDILLAFIR
jgi:hypothetical protein